MPTRHPGLPASHGLDLGQAYHSSRNGPASLPSPMQLSLSSGPRLRVEHGWRWQGMLVAGSPCNLPSACMSRWSSLGSDLLRVIIMGGLAGETASEIACPVSLAGCLEITPPGPFSPRNSPSTLYTEKPSSEEPGGPGQQRPGLLMPFNNCNRNFLRAYKVQSLGVGEQQRKVGRNLYHNVGH